MGGAAGAAVGVQALGGVYGVVQAKQQNDILRQNAQIAEQNIPFIRAKAANEARQLQVARYMTIGKQRAGYGKSGLAVAGSVFDLIEDSAANYDRDTSFAILEGELLARGQQREAALSRYQGGMLLPSAITGGVLNTAAMYTRTKLPFSGYAPA